MAFSNKSAFNPRSSTQTNKCQGRCGNRCLLQAPPHPQMQRQKAMDARPELAGIGSGAWDEIHDVFGTGDKYDRALDGEDDPTQAPKGLRYQDVSGPSLLSNYMFGPLTIHASI